MSLVLRQGVAKTPAMQVGLQCVKVVLKLRADGAGVAIFATFSIYQILPQLIELWGLNVQTEVEARKNLAKVSG